MSYTSHLSDVLKVMKDNKKEFCKKVGVLCVSEVQEVTPVGVYTGGKVGGNLKRSIVSEVMPRNKGVFVGANANAPYAIYVEKGIGQEPQPYLEPGVTNAIPKIINVAEDLYSRLGRG